MGNEKFKVIMLPTEKVSSLFSYNSDKHMLFYEHGRELTTVTTHFEIYFISDDEIEDGDWCIHNDTVKQAVGDVVPFANKHSKKIVATTDTDLRHLFGVKEGGCAAISESFVQEYIKSYNDGRIITEVELAISRNKYPDLHGNFYDINIGSDNTVLVLSHNQTVDVEPIKINEDDVDYLKATIKDREVLIGQLDYKRKELQESSDRGLTEKAELREEIKNLSEALQDMVNEFNVVTDARNETEQEEAMNNAIELLSKYKKD